MRMRRGRLMMLTLLALALPTAALAATIDYTTDTFSSGVIAHNFVPGFFSVNMLGANGFRISLTSVLGLSSGCLGATSCTFTGGTVTVTGPGGVNFTTMVDNGMISKNSCTTGAACFATITASLLPGGMPHIDHGSMRFNNLTFTGGSGTLTGGTASVVGFVPEPSALEGLLFGTGLLGLVEMARRKLRLGT